MMGLGMRLMYDGLENETNAWEDNVLDYTQLPCPVKQGYCIHPRSYCMRSCAVEKNKHVEKNVSKVCLLSLYTNIALVKYQQLTRCP